MVRQLILGKCVTWACQTVTHCRIQKHIVADVPLPCMLLLPLPADHRAHPEPGHQLQPQHPQGDAAGRRALVPRARAQQDQPGQPGGGGAAAVGGRPGDDFTGLCGSVTIGIVAGQLKRRCGATLVNGRCLRDVKGRSVECRVTRPSAGLGRRSSRAGHALIVHTQQMPQPCKHSAHSALQLHHAACNLTVEMHIDFHCGPAVVLATAGLRTRMWASCRTCTCQPTRWQRWPT